jgi:hypothetical protein
MSPKPYVAKTVAWTSFTIQLSISALHNSFIGQRYHCVLCEGVLSYLFYLKHSYFFVNNLKHSYTYCREGESASRRWRSHSLRRPAAALRRPELASQTRSAPASPTSSHTHPYNCEPGSPSTAADRPASRAETPPPPPPPPIHT